MKIRLTLDITRAPKPGPPQFEHRDTETLVERAWPQPVGFAPEEETVEYVRGLGHVIRKVVHEHR